MTEEIHEKTSQIKGIQVEVRECNLQDTKQMFLAMPGVMY
jgi:hypothetical protein